MNVAALVADLKDAFPRTKVTVEQLRVMVRELSDLPPDALEQAMRDLIRSEEFFPSISAIRQRAAERLLCLPTDDEALAQVQRRIVWAREASGLDAPDVHPVVKEALDHVGGFHAYRTAQKQEVIRAQFLKMYQQLRTGRIRDIQVDGGRALPAA